MTAAETAVVEAAVKKAPKKATGKKAVSKKAAPKKAASKKTAGAPIPGRLYQIIRAPRISEKTARLQEVSNQYVFEIATTATKADVKAAVEQLFDVSVLAVNVLNVKGKKKAFKSRSGQRQDTRKAYVKLADGQSIDVMAKA